MRADLHVHSARSHDGVLDRAAIAAAAKAKGIAAVAVCDHDKSPQAGDFPAKVEGGVLFIPAIEYSTGICSGCFSPAPSPSRPRASAWRLPTQRRRSAQQAGLQF